MPRKRTGTFKIEKVPSSPEARDGIYKGRIRLRDKSRPWQDIEPGKTEAEARAWLLKAQQREDKTGTIYQAKLAAQATRAKGVAKVPASDTIKHYFEELWIPYRRSTGISSVDEDEKRGGKHLVTRLGHLSIRAPGAELHAELEDFVAHLDKEVDASTMGWKSAANIWSLVSQMFKDAHKCKRRELRMRPDNPARGVQPPERGSRRARQFLYPNEFLQLVTCSRISLRWRRRYALATYLIPRTRELSALHRDDVSLEHGVVGIHRAQNRRDRSKTKKTKTGSTRRFAYERNVHDLLAVMVAEAGTSGRFVSMPRNASATLKRHLKMAGVTREELFISDETRQAITFHDATRATGITWMAIRGDDPLKIKHRAGHDDLETTMMYVRAAEALLGADFGEVFPPLPEALVRSVGLVCGAGTVRTTEKMPAKGWADWDSKTGTPGENESESGEEPPSAAGSTSKNSGRSGVSRHKDQTKTKRRGGVKRSILRAKRYALAGDEARTLAAMRSALRAGALRTEAR